MNTSSVYPSEDIAASVVEAMMNEKIFYAIVFMRKHSMTSTNRQKFIFYAQRLKNIFQKSIMRINELHA